MFKINTPIKVSITYMAIEEYSLKFVMKIEVTIITEVRLKLLEVIKEFYRLLLI